MFPVKATEQQEKCERAIMQQHMKQEIESNQYASDMLIDSASNYMQTKRSQFEGELAQSRQQIADLKREKESLAQKLANEKEKVKYIEKKLNAPQTEDLSKSHSIIMEEEEVDQDERAQELQASNSSHSPTSRLSKKAGTQCINTFHTCTISLIEADISVHSISVQCRTPHIKLILFGSCDPTAIIVGLQSV